MRKPAQKVLDTLMQEYAVVKKAEARKKELAQEIKTLLQEVPSLKDGICAGGYKATLSVYETTKFDTKRFKEDYPELYEAYSYKEPACKLNFN